MKDIKIIGVSGKIGAGKDEVCKIIQKLTAKPYIIEDEFGNPRKLYNLQGLDIGYECEYKTDWKVKKFAGILKQMVSLLIGCSLSQLEDQEFKNKPLGEEWAKYGIDGDHDFSMKDYGYVNTFEEACKLADNVGESYSFIKRIELTPRLIMQLLGTECMRDIIHPNSHVNALFANVKEDDKILISDTRFPNEADKIKEKRGIVIRINRPSIKRSAEHFSETALDDYKNFDYLINNDGTLEKLENEVRWILKDLNII